jgi:hypothetical protein
MVTMSGSPSSPLLQRPADPVDPDCLVSLCIGCEEDVDDQSRHLHGVLIRAYRVYLCRMSDGSRCEVTGYAFLRVEDGNQTRFCVTAHYQFDGVHAPSRGVYNATWSLFQSHPFPGYPFYELGMGCLFQP